MRWGLRDPDLNFPMSPLLYFHSSALGWVIWVQHANLSKVFIIRPAHESYLKTLKDSGKICVWTSNTANFFALAMCGNDNNYKNNYFNNLIFSHAGEWVLLIFPCLFKLFFVFCCRKYLLRCKFCDNMRKDNFLFKNAKMTFKFQ